MRKEGQGWLRGEGCGLSEREFDVWMNVHVDKEGMDGGGDSIYVLMAYVKVDVIMVVWIGEKSTWKIRISGF